MADIEAFGDLIEIGHGGHIKPALGHGHDNIGKAEIERGQDRYKIFLWRGFLPQKVCTGDAEINFSLAQVLGNFRRREESDFNIFDAFQLATIAAVGA